MALARDKSAKDELIDYSPSLVSHCLDHDPGCSRVAALPNDLGHSWFLMPATCLMKSLHRDVPMRTSFERVSIARKYTPQQCQHSGRSHRSPHPAVSDTLFEWHCGIGEIVLGSFRRGV